MTEGNDISKQQAVLAPIEVRWIDFHGDVVTAVLVEVASEIRVLVPLRPICEYLGLAWSSQLQRTKRHPILNKALGSVFIMNTEVGQRYEVTCLDLDYLNGWLFGIEANRVKEEMR